MLGSWANGDPALLVKNDPKTGEAIQALYPDDPANVHHSYLGDPVRFRNLHMGPKETHVFHLHAHQWLMTPRDQNSTYLDSQTISPGAAFTYEINYGGGGNRNEAAELAKRLRAADLKILVAEPTPPANEAERAQVFATVNGERITSADVEGSLRPLILKTQEQIYDLRKQQLDLKINDVLLEQEALKRKITSRALIDLENKL